MDEEAEHWKRRLAESGVDCNRLKDKIKTLEKEKRISGEREKRGKQRIFSLEDEIERMASDQREKCADFSKKFEDSERRKRRAEDKVEIWKKKFKDSESGKRRAEDEVEIWKKKSKDSESGKRSVDDENDLLKKKCRELEIQARQMLNHGAELEDYKTKCHGLSTMLKVKEMECIEFEAKLKNLVLTKVALDHELEDYNTTCNRMEEEDGGKIMPEREKTSNERIACFEELVKKVESDVKYMLVQLKNENMVLECGIRRAEDESENWKKRFSELNMGLGNLQKEVGNMDGRVNVASVSHLTKSEKVLSPALLPGANFSSLHGNFEDAHVSDTPKIKSQCDHSAYVKVEKESICSESSDTKVELVSEARQQPGSETGVNCKENLVLPKQDSVTISSTCIIEIDSEEEVIEVSDGEDEKDIPLKHTCNNKGEDVEHASTDGTLKTRNKYLKMPLSIWGSGDKDIPFSSPMKRCKFSASLSVSQEDDKFPNVEI
ncbi:hypothetical protein MKW92_045902 [Papaver armeniacum]|nr:hypothetical protein MKW92_045902 [Papaver armeniacum]